MGVAAAATGRPLPPPPLLLLLLLMAVWHPCHSFGTLYGLPDASVVVGRLFNYTIPNDAFKGQVDRFQASFPPINFHCIW